MSVFSSLFQRNWYRCCCRSVRNFFSKTFLVFATLKNHSFAQSNSESSSLCLTLFVVFLFSLLFALWQTLCIWVLCDCFKHFELIPPVREMENESLFKKSVNCFRDRSIESQAINGLMVFLILDSFSFYYNIW